LRKLIYPITAICNLEEAKIGRGDIVLDPFAGSGTTLVTAEKTGRARG